METLKKTKQDCCQKKFQGAHEARSQEVRSPTCEVLDFAAKTLGTHSIFLGAPGSWAPVRQRPCQDCLNCKILYRTLCIALYMSCVVSGVE